MRQTRVARRYAQALMDLAEESKRLVQITNDLESLHRMLRESREFVLFLKSPVIKGDRKKEVLKELFQSTLDATTQSFLELLAEKGREDILDEIITQFLYLRDEKLGIVAVDVKAAVEFDPDQKTRLEERFVSLTKKKVRISFSLEKVLKGGFVARLGDTVYDGSVQRQLEMLRAKFAEGTTHN